LSVVNRPPIDDSTNLLLVRRALEAGRGIDLTGCVYESAPRPDGGAPFTPPYYHLLAGLVRSERLTRILEIGTFHGGATLSMAQGVDDDLRDELDVCTVDVVRLNERALARPGIRRVLGDALRADIRRQVVGSFDRHIDLLFVDAGHDYRQTWEHIALYANRLKPRFIVVDDIRLNRSMRRLWAALTQVPSANPLDLSELVDRSGPGFGVLVPSYPCHFDEMGGVRRAAWMTYWRVGRVISRLLPPKLSEQVRLALRGGR
jgi:predicted O-methyltransferase YrrM